MKRGKLVVNDDDMEIKVPEFQSSALKELIGQGVKRRLDSEQIPIDRIDPDPEQPRHHFDPGRIQELSETIQQNGLMRPLAVRPVENGRFLLIDGERRYRASQMAGLQIVPVLVYHDLTETEVRRVQLYEILHNEQVSPMEEARFIVRYKEETQRTWNELARELGQSPETLMRKARLVEAPAQVQEMVDAGRISLTHAYDLLRLPPEEQVLRAQEVVETGLTTRELGRIRQERKTDQPLGRSSLGTVIDDGSSEDTAPVDCNAPFSRPAVSGDGSSAVPAMREERLMKWAPPAPDGLGRVQEPIKMTAQIPGNIHALISKDMEHLGFRRYADYVRFCLDTRLREVGLLAGANTDGVQTDRDHRHENTDAL